MRSFTARLGAGMALLASLALMGATLSAPASAAPAETCQGERATIVGTPQADRLEGTSRRDVIAAGAGNDLVRGLDGDDLICGDRGRDRIEGGDGADQLFGSRGRDTLTGGPRHFGASLNVLSGGPGRDLLVGSRGNRHDVADYSPERRGVTVDVRHPARSDDVLRGFEAVIGTNHDDTLRLHDLVGMGMGGSDRLRGSCWVTDWQMSAGLKTYERRIVPLRDATADGDDVIRGQRARDIPGWCYGYELAAGRDRLVSPEPRRVAVHDLGDRIEMSMPAPSSRYSTAELALEVEVADLHIDVRKGTLSSGAGSPVTQFENIWWFETWGDVERATFRGTDRPENLSSYSDTEWEAHMGGGKDQVGDPVLGVVYGGGGSDFLSGPATFHAGPGDDRVLAEGIAFGGAGDDSLTWWETSLPHRALKLHGGSGDDVLGGTDLDDDLYGDEGKDEIFGHQGIDTCDGEVEHDCEL